LRVLLALCAALSLSLVAAPAASAAAGDVGFKGPSYSGATAPTGEKPESKLWFNDGRWWASMYHTGSKTWHIYYLNRSASPESWVDTGTVIDSRANTSNDALWSNNKLYIASHVKATSNTTVTSGQPARLYRYSYSTATKTYTLDSGFPNSINNTSSETLVMDRDASGRLWATWTQAQKVYVNSTSTGDVWGTPQALTVTGAQNLEPDDISTLVAFADKVGVLWSNQTNSTVYFSYRNNADAVASWKPSVAATVAGAGQADDHINIKSIQADSSGRVFAVIKTSLETTGQSAPQIVVVSRSAAGTWSRATFGTVADCHTRPILMVDSTNNKLHVYATAPDSGCPFTGSAGTIFEKTSSLDSLSFPAGRGTPVIRDAASANLNNATGSKQTVSAATGIVILAGNDSTKTYWFSDQSLGGTPPPTGVNVSVSEDAFVRSTEATTNFGNDATLQADSADPTELSYLKFDLSAYAGRTLQSAKLNISTAGSNSSAGSEKIKLVPTTSWTESTLNYSNKPAVGSTALGSVTPNALNTRYSVTLTASELQSALGGTLALAIDPVSNSDGADFASSESANPPVLTLTFN
jgi:hypothetical protein